MSLFGKPERQSFVPCPGGSGIIGGKVYGDYNYNGLNDQVGGIRGMKVYLFACDVAGNSRLADSTTSDVNGDYFFAGLADGKKYRLEFIPPADKRFLKPGFGGSDSGSDVQFVTAPNCNAHVGFVSPDDFCENNPQLMTSCFVNGDPLPANSEAANMDVIVAFPYNSTGQTTMPSKLVVAKQIGSVYGLAYQRTKKYAFTSAFLKRHVGLGPLGLGGIYRINPATTPLVVSNFIDVKTIGIDVGNIPSNSGRGLPLQLNLPSNDAQAYGNVAKIGIGTIDVSYDGNLLWLVNLNDKKLYSIKIDADNNVNTPPAAADVTAYSLPNPGCQGGIFRPFAVKYHHGDIYVGGVCDASISKNPADLEAIVYRLRNGIFTSVLRFDLAYKKGWAANQNNCDLFSGWYEWRDDVPPTCDSGPTRVYPQPVLSDIEFDVDGSMVLGFMDRLGHQLGYKNYPISGSSPLLNTVSGGDVLRAFIKDDGSFELEKNGKAGDVTTGGAGNNEGPGGGEYYFRDVFEGQINNILPAPHQETAQGGLAFQPGSGEIATTALDPYGTVFNSGGINWFNNNTGAIRDEGYLLYRSSTSSISNFSKANGLGDLTVICGLAPLQMGGLVWTDENSNGIQDACELPLAGVRVALYNQSGTQVGTTTTNAKGQYFFQNINVNGGQLTPNTNYFIAVGTGGQFNISNRKLNNNLFLTQPNIGMDPRPDYNDSDGILANAATAGGAFTGLPFTAVRTGDVGDVNHSFDFGFTPENLFPVAGVGGFVWNDGDKDGIQDSGEQGIADVTVKLLSQNGAAVQTVQSNGQGNYFFSDVLKGDYVIEFVKPGGYTPSPQNTGNGRNDSDPNVATGKTTLFTFDPKDGDNSDVDAGFYIATGSIGGVVFKDCNKNGIRENGEAGWEGITVRLSGTATQTSVTDANGNYAFDGLISGNYQVTFVKPTTPSGLQFSPKDNGTDDNNDSDADPATGETNNIHFFAGQNNTNTFAGLIDVEVPRLIGIPSNAILGCKDPQLTTPPTVTATDNLDLNVQVQMTESIKGTACQNGLIIIRTWTATDNCGNSATASQQITTGDGAPPTISGAPSDVTVNCNHVPNPPTVYVQDDCDDTPTLTFSETRNGHCPEILTRRWTATDDCGNTSTAIQKVSIVDDVAPVLAVTHSALSGRNPGDTIVIQCDETLVFSANDAHATDDCGTPAIRFSERNLTPPDCFLAGFVALKTLDWAAEDDCGNVTEVHYFVKTVDRKAPVLLNIPPDLTVDLTAGDTVPSPPNNVTGFDDCSGTLTVSFATRTEQLTCQQKIYRTWTATDNCQNSISKTQTITVLQDCDCPNVEITGVAITAACRNVGGTAKVRTSGDPSEYKFVWIPNRGTPGAGPNERTNLPPGTYLVIISHPVVEDCDDKIYFQIIEDCPPTTEICDNGADDDGDGLADCDDPDCDCPDDLCLLFSIFDQPYVGILLEDCHDTADFCMNIPPQDLGKYRFELDGSIIQPAPIGCDYQVNSTQTVPGTALRLPFGKYWLKVMELATGCIDTVDIVVYCLPDYQKKAISLNIQFNEKDTVCLASELDDHASSRFFGCLGGKCKSAAFEELSPSCFVVTGVAAGTDTLIYKVCDKLGFCDTTIVTVKVNWRQLDLPIAVSDTATFERGQPMICDILENDIVPGKITDFRIIQAGFYGTVVVNPDFSVTYLPEKNNCREDEFMYKVCNADGCDAAKVRIKTSCADILIPYNAISPNGDGLNDRFVVIGAEQQSDLALKIFNRWGNMVYQTDHYQNDWEGTYNGSDLPAGTYFYTVTYDSGKQLSGYIYILQ